MNTVIQTQTLSKRYKDVCAVSDNNISVSKGEIYGFLGLNGAGKTTTIRMLLGLVKPTSGKAFLNGEEVKPSNTSLWEKVGYLVEVPYAYPMLTVRENLEMIRTLRRIKDPKSIDRVIDRLDLGAYANRKAKNLSLGNKQRLGLAKALIHHPEILILDEPTNGLDPAGIHDIREMLIDLAENLGVTIFLSSHILGEISQFATRIGIIHKGNMIKEIQSHQLAELCNQQLVIKTDKNQAGLEYLSDKGFKGITTSGDQIMLNDIDAIKQPELISRLLIQQGFELSKLNLEQENLESYFLRTIKEKEA